MIGHLPPRILMVAICLLLACSCSTADSWRLVHGDSFERSEPGPNWAAAAGTIRIVDGSLEIRSNGVGKAMLAGSYPADVKVTFTAWTPAGVQRCDLTPMINTDNDGANSGYFLGYGSWMDTMNHILKDGDQEVTRTSSHLIGANDRKHRITAVHDGTRVYLDVDGRRVLNYVDADPCCGVGEDRIGFYTWCSAMRIDDLRVYVKGSPPKKPSKADLTLPVRRGDKGKLTVRGASRGIASAISLFNDGQIDKAYLALATAPNSFIKAAALAWVIGDPGFDMDRKGTLALLACLDRLPPREANKAQARTLRALTQRLAVLAGAAKGNASHYLPRLLDNIHPGHPFYDKALLYQGRVYAWEYMEAIKPRPWERSDAIFRPLLAKYPDNRIIRMYLGESVPWEKDVSCRDPKAPAWARELAEAYLRSIAVIEWWGANRQSPDGSVGGGWGDDVELLRTWGPIAAIADGNKLVQNTVRRMADGVWRSDAIRGTGYDTFRSDVEHSAEPSSDTQPLMMYLAYGDPEYVERNLVSARLIRDKLMGRNSYGHWHWRSNQLSSEGPSKNPKYAVDVPYACRAFKHVQWLNWYSDNPGTVKMFLDWARSWAEDTMRAGDGKPAGVVPAVVGFAEDRLAGTSIKWDEPDLGWSYYNWNGGSWMYDLFAQAYARKPDEVYLAPIRAALDCRKQAPADMPAWIVEKLASTGSNDAVQALRLYETVTGAGTFQDITRGTGSNYEGFLGNGKRTSLENLIHTLRESMEGNFEMLTSEVISTDRAGIWCSEDLLRIYGGTPMLWNDTRPPLMSVRWSSPSDRFAALVTETKNTSLKAVLYSFAGRPVKLGASLFRLKPGLYELKIGPDANDDWVMDSVEETREVAIAHRGDGFEFDLPAARQVMLELHLKKALSVDADPLPDLAVTSRDIVRRGNALDIIVHNIGGRDAGAFTVRVADAASGQTLASKKVKSLPCPADLQAKTLKLHVPVARGAKELIVSIDYEGYEITTRNNAARIRPG